MYRRSLLIAAFTFLAGVHAMAKEVKDTLVSTANDRIIVTYDITQNNGQATILFKSVRKFLGPAHRDKYKLDEIEVIFFDRIGNYGDGMRFSGMNVKPFMAPGYNQSREGYMLLRDKPVLTLEIPSSETFEFSVPLYIAHYEGTRRYKLISRCDGFVVKINVAKQGKVQKVTRTRRAEVSNDESGFSDEYEYVNQTITVEEDDGSFTPLDEANILIGRVSDLLAQQDGYPFSDNLKDAIGRLRDCRYKVNDPQIVSRIDELLSACESKENNLKGEATAAAESQAKLAQEQAQAKQDSIAAAAQQKADEEKTRNFWLIIVGIVLAVLGYVGNQLLQHYRNVKNQKNLVAMQENVVKRAENEAKRRSQSMVNRKVGIVKNEARSKTRDIVNGGISKATKGRVKKIKNISI